MNLIAANSSFRTTISQEALAAKKKSPNRVSELSITNFPTRRPIHLTNTRCPLKSGIHLNRTEHQKSLSET